jgi:hypothetical protein
MKSPAMNAVLSHESGTTTATVTVEHHIGHSYSRAVDPRAMREANARLPKGRAWEKYAAAYGHDTDGDRTHSTFYFRVCNT